jgi:UDP-N-acetylmuramate--alanine ligase
VEVREAARRQIPVIPRAEMLAELMRLRFSIAVAGSHGKTTTTSMIALVLERAGLDPTAVIGGRLSAFGSNARLGKSELMVAEADESDRSFLKLSPTIAVMTNIDHEHLENYGGFDDLQQAFVDFANKVPFYGAVVACADDPSLAAVLPRITRRVRTYALDAKADVRAGQIELGPFSAAATVAGHGDLRLNVPGRHNLQNALAAVAVGLELGLPFDRNATGLAEFRGAERRFEVTGEPHGILVVDDYGHHPTEIAAVIAAAKTLKRRIVIAFQPHRYSRTAALMHAFGPSLAGADHIVLTDIYSAGEDAMPGVTIDALAEEVRRSTGTPVDVVKKVSDLAAALARIAKRGDVVLTLGAGSIGSVGAALVDVLAKPFDSAQGKDV